MNIENENAKRRAVEALAQALYESQNPGGVAWVKRSPTIREPWLVQARRQLQVSAPKGPCCEKRGEIRTRKRFSAADRSRQDQQAARASAGQGSCR